MALVGNSGYNYTNTTTLFQVSYPTDLAVLVQHAGTQTQHSHSLLAQPIWACWPRPECMSAPQHN